MSWKKFRENKWFSVVAVFSSIYVIVLTGFVIWMVFFDTNSFLIHRELNKEIEKLEKKREFLKVEIEKDKKVIERLSDPEELEKFAREKYYLKKKNEEIYLIEYEDSLKVKQ